MTIGIQAKARKRHLIDQAAERLGRSRSDFLLEPSCRQADDLLLDQSCFAGNAGRFASFQALRDNPPAVSGRLRRT